MINRQFVVKRQATAVVGNENETIQPIRLNFHGARKPDGDPIFTRLIELLQFPPQ